MTERLTDLFIEFDEMGFSPTIPCEDFEKAAAEWKKKVIKEIDDIKTELRQKVDYINELWEVKEDYKHRAEVAEKKYKIALVNYAKAHRKITHYNKMTTTYDREITEQAEKELAEERKDD